MRPIALSQHYVAGELFARAGRNYDRLEQERWLPDTVYQDPEYAWPGDMEGRSILALTLLAQATHRRPRHLDQIMKLFPEHLNEKGYFGRILEDGCDEQQLSSHGWVLRGLCEYYLWRGCTETLAQIRAIVDNLVLPASRWYDSYPTNPERRQLSAGHIGELQAEKIGDWYSSTDIGCAFILLDGVVQAYEILKDPALKPVIEQIIAIYLAVDFEGMSCQTHATLTGLRGVLRYYELEHDPLLLEAAVEIWDLYTRKGMSEHYGNHNWFGRPQLTEPCAIVDSFMVATTLWRLTGTPRHLDMAHHILYNSFYHGQRSNGGFGCDSCVGADSPILELDEIYESWWCCTMRAGEGFKSAIEHAYLMRGDEVTVPFFGDSTTSLQFTSGTAVVVQRTRYPKNGTVLLEVVESTVAAPVTFRFFVPEWANTDGLGLVVNGTEHEYSLSEQFLTVEIALNRGCSIELTLPITLRVSETMSPASIKNHHSFRHGPLILGCVAKAGLVSVPRDAPLNHTGDAIYKVEGSGLTLTPTGDIIHMSEDEAKACRLQTLFEER